MGSQYHVAAVTPLWYRWRMRTYLDTRKLRADIDSIANADGKSMRQVAKEIGVPPSTLTRMKYGLAPSGHNLMAMLVWVGENVERYVRRGA